MNLGDEDGYSGTLNDGKAASRYLKGGPPEKTQGRFGIMQLTRDLLRDLLLLPRQLMLMDVYLNHHGDVVIVLKDTGGSMSFLPVGTDAEVQLVVHRGDDGIVRFERLEVR